MTEVASAQTVTWSGLRMFKGTMLRLAARQSVSLRDIQAERRIAEAAGEYLHLHDNQDLMISIDLQFRFAFWTRYLCRADIADREDWQRVAIGIAGSVEESCRLVKVDGARLRTYFHAFRLGTDLGYPEEMGEKWYACFSDESGTHYIPVDAVETIFGSGF